MPSATEKAYRLSKNHHRLNPEKLNQKISLSNCLVALSKRFGVRLIHRLGNRHPDMPQDGELRGLQTRNKSSSEIRKKNKSNCEAKACLISSAQSEPVISHLGKARDQKIVEGSGAESGRSLARQTENSSLKNQVEVRDLHISLPPVPDKLDAETVSAKISPSNSHSTTSKYLKHCIEKKLEGYGQKFVDSLMYSLLQCLNDKLEVLEELCEDESPKTHASCDSSSHKSSGGRKPQNSKRSAAGSKRHLREDESDEQDGEDYDGNGRRDKHNKRAKRSPKEEEKLRIFACPFYKRDPERFRQCRTCSSPSFKNMHRLKEHLMRRHRLPEQCVRCCEFFETEEDLNIHMRSSTACPVVTKERDLLDGFDKKKEKKLKERPRTDAAERWREIYCILFDVDHDSPDIPSPYHESLHGQAAYLADQDISEVKQFTTIMRDKLPMAVHKAVTAEVLKATSSLGHELLPKVLENLKDEMENMARTFGSIRPPPKTSGPDSVEQGGYNDGSSAMDHVNFILKDMQPEDFFDFRFDDGGCAYGSSFAETSEFSSTQPTSVSSFEGIQMEKPASSSLQPPPGPAAEDFPASLGDHTSYQLS